MSKKPISNTIYWISAVVLLALVIFTMWPRPATGLGPNANNRPHYAQGEMTIQRADGEKVPFKVEIARTPQEHEYGLMFVQSMPHDQGMIFMQTTDSEATFWMKNTLIPLDMLFVRKDGTVAKIAANAKPLDLSPIRSDEPVQAIIEINGGEAALRGFHEGDKVLFPGLGEGAGSP